MPFNLDMKAHQRFHLFHILCLQANGLDVRGERGEVLGFMLHQEQLEPQHEAGRPSRQIY